MKILIFPIFAFLLFFNISASETIYQADKLNILYKNVAKYYSLEELTKLLNKKEVVEIDDETNKNLRFILDPVSVKKQALQHKEFIPKLVNEETVKQGVEFFSKYRELFKDVYEKTKVHPSDIVAILNWESRLGTFTGNQQVIKIFIGQFFFPEKYNELLIKEGAYKKEGAMTRANAEKRIERLKKNALANLTALLIQAKLKNFDPVQVKGSWAGAIGFPQFMPASMRYAVDGNNDGKIDLFTMEDAIASVANYLKENGYNTKGREHSFKRYNPDSIYAKGVKMYSDMAKKAGLDFN